MSREIFVYGDWEQLGQVRRMGQLRADRVRGKEVLSFEHGRWLCISWR